MGKMIKVVRVEAFLMPTPPYVPVITCHLEDGRQFTLYYVPYEIVIAINRIQGEKYDVERESVFDVLPMVTGDLKDKLKNRIKAVYIDYLNKETMLYTATMEIKIDGAIVRRRTIPSHAIYLALLSNSDIYILDDLVKQQEEMSSSSERREL